jgi:hypothetical protein
MLWLSLVMLTAAFEEVAQTDLQQWQVQAPDVATQVLEVDGAEEFEISVPEGVAPGFPRACLRLPATPGLLLEFRSEVWTEGVDQGYGAYITLEHLDAEGKRISYEQSGPAFLLGQWNALVARGVTPPGTQEVMLCWVLNGHGTGRYRAPVLEQLSNATETPVPEEVQVTVSAEALPQRVVGFGAEDDGWFYAPVNLEKGVTEEDIKLREERIRWMDPDWVRMFFWYKDWNPSGDWETFTFDSPNMESHYRSLALYQEIGAAVNVTGVEWGMDAPWAQPEQLAKAVGALLEYLIKDRGLTCVKYWTLTNEPNLGFVRDGRTFQDFVRLHTLVKAQIDARGLDVQVVGSDETNGGWPWFKACVEDAAYFETAGTFASHRYFQSNAQAIIPRFFEERLTLLAGRKPLIIAEFGFQDKRSGVMDNPLMEEYPYAVWTSAFAIEGLNQGVAGMNIWCLHEMYYSFGSFMNYGLWNFKNRDWSVRPVYHAWAQFTRLTEAGDAVRPCTTSHPSVKAVVVGERLFFVNTSDTATRLRVEGLDVEQVRVMQETSLHGDRECGEVVKVEEGVFVAPAMSFGHGG